VSRRPEPEPELDPDEPVPYTVTPLGYIVAEVERIAAEAELEP
jgi:hypothetical protein